MRIWPLEIESNFNRFKNLKTRCILCTLSNFLFLVSHIKSNWFKKVFFATYNEKNQFVLLPSRPRSNLPFIYELLKSYGQIDVLQKKFHLSWFLAWGPSIKDVVIFKPYPPRVCNCLHFKDPSLKRMSANQEFDPPPPNFHEIWMKV